MDPVCHTLVGASLGATGLAGRTRLGYAALILAANVPDVDAVLYFSDDARSYAFRRGITHGIPGVAVLAALLALALWVLSRALHNRPAGMNTSLCWLVILAMIGAASHPALDWLNNYGVRWLMPITDAWYYGDTLFIVDPVVWIVLAAGLVAARRPGCRGFEWYRQPATLALGFVVAYIAMSHAVTQFAEATVHRRTADEAPQRMMASPVPLDPFERDIVLDYGDHYRFGTFALLPRPRLEWDGITVVKGDPAMLERVRRTRDGRWFLSWARFPYVVVERAADGLWARLADARYVRNVDSPRLRSFGEISIRLDEPPADD